MSADKQARREFAQRSEPGQKTLKNVGLTPHAFRADYPGGDEQRPQDKPADRERDNDSHEPRLQKLLRTFAVKRHVAEEARDKEEQRHAKRVADEREG